MLINFVDRAYVIDFLKPIILISITELLAISKSIANRVTLNIRTAYILVKQAEGERQQLQLHLIFKIPYPLLPLSGAVLDCFGHMHRCYLFGAGEVGDGAGQP